jgi:hypothetical protein
MLVGWTSDGQTSPSYHVYARRLNADGTPAGAEARLTSSPSQFTTGNPRFAVSPSGDVLLTDQQPNPITRTAELGARHFPASGTDFGTEQVLAEVAAAPQGIWEPDGTLNLFWHALGPDGSADVVTQRYSVDTNAVALWSASVFSTSPIDEQTDDGDDSTVNPLLD